MAQAGTIAWLVVGASLLGVVSRGAVPPATWVALTALVHASRSMRAGTGLLLVWATLFVFLSIGRRGILQVPGPAYFGIVAADALGLTLPFVLDRLTAPRLSGISTTLVFPIALVAAEFLRSRFTAAATWFSIAYSQYGCLTLMQLAAVTGIWGITFVVAWFASTFDFVWSRGFEWRLVGTPAVVCAVVLGAICVGGSIRLLWAPTDRPSIRAATLNRPVDLFVPGEMTRIAEGRLSPEDQIRLGEKLRRLHDWFLDGSRREARAGARLVVWPEQNLLIFKEDEPTFLERAQRLAAEERVYLAMGIGAIHLGAALPFENKVVLIDPSGRIIESYLKSHPVPGWEAGIMRAGDGRLPVTTTKDGRFATAICFDADFPEFIRQAGQASADVVILPANDWRAIKHLHMQMHAFRAIENGAPLVRAAASGLSAAFDPWGRVLAVSDFFAPGDRIMIAQVPVGHVGTLYAKTGDLFAWLCVAGVGVAVWIVAVGSRWQS